MNLQLGKVVIDHRGKLTFWDPLPFPVWRAWEITNVPEGQDRGNHAHQTCAQFMVCLRGSVMAEITPKGQDTEYFQMGPGTSLTVPPLHWIRLFEFSGDASILVLASEGYSAPITDRTGFCGADPCALPSEALPAGR